MEHDSINLGFGMNAKNYNKFPYVVLNKKSFLNFKVYVNEKNYFLSNLPPTDKITLPEKYGKMPNKNFYDIRKLEKDTGVNLYFRSLAAMYTASYLCGVTEKHITPSKDVHPILTSLCCFYLYFWWSRFMKNPKLLSTFDLGDLWKHLPLYEKDWDIYNSRDGNTNTITGVISRNLNADFLRYIATDGDGFTSLGLRMLQGSIEAFVYCLLGAQAKTRWSIVQKGAQSLQTQNVFRKLVSDVIVQSDTTITISNMRRSISDCNVPLNLVCNPDVILLPSSCIILKEAIPGYNNVLLHANKTMKFGVNTGLNFIAEKKKPEVKKIGHTTNVTPATPTPVETPTKESAAAENVDYSNIIALVGSAIVGRIIFSRFI